MKSIAALENASLKDIKQKAKIKWARHGDENSKFFHGMFNNKFNRSKIHGLLIDGSWITLPSHIKEHILNSYKTKFEEILPTRARFLNPLFKTLSSTDVLFLDSPFTLIETKEAVWNCGEDKSPGPDGFTFKFIQHHWDTIGNEIFAFVKNFELTGSFPIGCNSSFIALIPKINDPLTIGDFRPISLIGCQYKIIAKILASRLAKVIDSIVGETQTAYIRDRQIIDSPLMVDEILNWAKKKRKCIMFFIVDFEKAFDSVNWVFLVSVMEQMGFSSTWRNWIMGCLNKGRASIIVNGSPTREFEIQKGLRQGDPLSPFLFIIAMEALSVTMLDAVNRNIFQGVLVGKDKVHVSHLQFADDALIMGVWSRENAINLSRMLNCFHLASGLKINYSKSKIFGVGVPQSSVNTFASILGCQVATFPTTYLGLPIGSRMTRCSSWSPIVDKFHKKLSSWKSKNLSFGGRLTLIKSVLGSLGTYFFSLFKAPVSVLKKLEGIRRTFFWGGSSDDRKIPWVAWDKTILPRKHGGLGVGGLHVSNLAMLAKWWWRFRVETKALWTQIIKSIHGNDGGLNRPEHHYKHTGTWGGILKLHKEFLNLNIDLPLLYKKKVVDGNDTSFWNDNWIGNIQLRTEFNRLYILDTSPLDSVSKKFVLVNSNWSPNWVWRRQPRTEMELHQLAELSELLSQWAPSNGSDTWAFTLGPTSSFNVKTLRRHIMDITATPSGIISSSPAPALWNNLVPIKTNIFIWRLMILRLPTRLNLSNKNIDLHSVLCPCCESEIEDEFHVFASCNLARKVWAEVFQWWNLPHTNFTSISDILHLQATAPVSAHHRKHLDAVRTTCWTIWNHRNQTIFNSVKPRCDTLGDSIKLCSFLWISNRDSSGSLEWIAWTCDPRSSLSPPV